MSNPATSAKVDAPVALPKVAYEVGNYQGYEDNAFHWSGPRNKPDAQVTFGTLVHDAKSNATKHDLKFPASLGRSGIREMMHKSGGKPKDRPVKFKAGEAVGDIEKPDGLYNGPEYADRPEAHWLIPNITMEAGYTIASGRSQAGKSFCELAQALSIVTGKPWLGEPVEKTGTILFVAAEGQERIWKDVCAWCAVFGIEPESLLGKLFIFDRSVRLNTDKGMDELDAILNFI